MKLDTMHWSFLKAVALGATVTALIACGDGRSADAPIAPEPGAEGESATEGGAAAAHGALDEEPTPPPVAREAFARAVMQVFDDWAEKEAELIADYEPSFKAALGELRWYRRLSTRAYEEREFKPIFSAGTELRRGADVLLEHLYAVAEHGLDPEPYGLEALKDLVRAYSEKSIAYQRALILDSEAKPVWQFLSAQRARLPLDERGIVNAAAEADLSDEDLPLLTAAVSHLGDLLASRRGLNAALRDLDIALTTRYLRYIYDMRFAKRAHPFLADATEGAGVERTAEDVYKTFMATDFDAIGPSLAALVPRMPEYQLLKEGLALYRGYAAAYPEHVELPPAVERLRRQRTPRVNANVKLVQTRLQHEEYWDGEVDGLYTEALEEAIRFYQETHQLRETGFIDRITRLSLNRTFAERAQQLELSLQRHRESDFHQGEETYLFGNAVIQARINVPAFEVTFFKDGEVARTHNIIVGNNNIDTDPNTRLRGRFNQTRMISAEMRTIVLNPTWNVPPRIKETDLDLKLIDQPDFYERNNYEVQIRPDGTERVVQLPGPNNALGLVKFLFPNDFAIYMHDTPNKRLFQRPVRAFSYGCMRTENPLDLARWILVDNMGWTDQRFDQVLRSRQEYGVAVRPRIPVTIDYNTVGVHSSGKMMFYADVYHYDRDLLAGDTPYRQDRRHHLTVMVR